MAEKKSHESYGQWSATRGASALLSGTLATASLFGQTAVDLHNQAKDIDFSNASTTKVWKTGATLPQQCKISEGFFLTSANAGQNLYLCSATNTWTLVTPQLAGSGTLAQSVAGALPPAAVPSVDATGTEVNSGCTASAAAMICAGGISSGTGASRITATEGSAPSAPQAAQQTLYFDSADHEMKSIDSGGSVRQYASTSGAETFSNKTLMNPSLGMSAFTMRVANEQTTGTTANHLAKLTGAPSAAIVTSTTDTVGALGVAMSGAGITGTVEIATSGQAVCVFDGPAIAGDYVTISNAIVGDCHDAGLTYPVGLQIVGRVMASNTGAGSNPVELFPAEVRGSSAVTGTSSFDPLDETVAWWRDEMTINNQWYVFATSGGSLGLSGNPDGNHPGVFQLQTGGSTGSVTAMLLAWNNGAMVMHYPSGAWDMRWVVEPGTLSGSTYTFGFGDNSGANQVILSYRPSVGSDWLGVVRTNNVDTIVDLGVPASTSSYARLRMRSDGTVVYFSVNGGAETTICASGCSASSSIGLNGSTAVSVVAAETSLTTGQQSLFVDFFALEMTGLSR